MQRKLCLQQAISSSLQQALVRELSPGSRRSKGHARGVTTPTNYLATAPMICMWPKDERRSISFSPAIMLGMLPNVPRS